MQPPLGIPNLHPVVNHYPPNFYPQNYPQMMPQQYFNPGNYNQFPNHQPQNYMTNAPKTNKQQYTPSWNNSSLNQAPNQGRLAVSNNGAMLTVDRYMQLGAPMVQVMNHQPGMAPQVLQLGENSAQVTIGDQAPNPNRAPSHNHQRPPPQGQFNGIQNSYNHGNMASPMGYPLPPQQFHGRPPPMNFQGYPQQYQNSTQMPPGPFPPRQMPPGQFQHQMPQQDPNSAQLPRQAPGSPQKRSQHSTMSTGERYNQHRSNENLEPEGEYEPYSYRDWLILKNRDQSKKSSKLGISKDEKWAEKQEKKEREKIYSQQVYERMRKKN